MSQDRADVVRRVWQLSNEGEINAALEHFTDDARWKLIGGFAPLMGEEFVGHDEIRRFIAEWNANLEGDSELESVLEAGDKVVTVVITRGIGGRSGAPAEMRWGQVISFRGDKVSALDNYYEAEDALAAVGLEQ